MPITRSQLVQRLASSADISRRDADVVLSTVVEAVSQALAEGDRIELRAFGMFTPRERPAREARNPRTGEAVAVDAKRTIHFRAGKQMLQILNDDPEALTAFREQQHRQLRRRDEKQGQLSLF